jgi:hypothetical protein
MSSCCSELSSAGSGANAIIARWPRSQRSSGRPAVRSRVRKAS